MWDDVISTADVAAVLAKPFLILVDFIEDATRELQTAQIVALDKFPFADRLPPERRPLWSEVIRYERGCHCRLLELSSRLHREQWQKRKDTHSVTSR